MRFPKTSRVVILSLLLLALLIPQAFASPNQFALYRVLNHTTAGVTTTPLRINISDFNATAGTAFEIVNSSGSAVPFNYLDANEHITNRSNNASYLLVIASTAQNFTVYYNNITPVNFTPAFLQWDRFINSSNNLPWTIGGGSWTFSSGYAEKTAAAGSYVYAPIQGLYNYKDLGVFARVYYAGRGDSMRVSFRQNPAAWNSGTELIDDFGPTNYRAFGASAYSSSVGGGGSLTTWHDYTFRVGTSSNTLYEDEGAAIATWAVPTDEQIGSSANNYTGMGGQELGIGRFDDYAAWNWSLLGRVNFYNALSTGYNLTAAQLAPGGVTNFSITATDNFTTASLSNFSVTISNGVLSYNLSTTSGTITTPVLSNSTSLWNISISSNQSGGYHNRTILNQNVSGASVGIPLDKYFRLYNVTYTGYVTYNGSNFTRTLNYTLIYTCPSFSNTTIERLINGTSQANSSVSCSNATQMGVGSYQGAAEGVFNISFGFNTDVVPASNNLRLANQTFIQDLNQPTITILSFNVTQGFVNPIANVTLQCTDTMVSNVTYNLTFNNVTIFYGNHTSGTNQSNTSAARDGTNTAVANCSDLFGSTSSSVSHTVYTKELQLIDERLNSAFDVTNVSSAKAYFDDNSSFFDFKSNGSSKVNFTSMNTDKLRIELTYAAGTVITRYVDVSLLSAPIRICANKEGVTHYEQLMISATQRPVVLKSVYANCVIAADYTRFAYQDAYLLKAYSINSVYYLYTYVDGTQTFLASLDGSVSSYVNLDTLEFKQQGYNFNILGEALSFRKTGANEVSIYYQNLAEDNTAANFVIVRMDTNAVVFNSSDFANPDEFTVVFDYSSLNNVTNETLFYGLVTKTDATGTGTVKRYFNAQGSSGSLRSPVAFVVALLLVVFGLTFTATRFTFGWFGIFVMIASIAVLSFAVTTWYITLLMAIDVILLVYIVILLSQQNYQTVS